MRDLDPVFTIQFLGPESSNERCHLYLFIRIYLFVLCCPFYESNFPYICFRHPGVVSFTDGDTLHSFTVSPTLKTLYKDNQIKKRL